MNKWKLFFDIVFIIQSDVIDFNVNFDAFDIIDKYGTLRSIAKVIEDDRRSTVSQPLIDIEAICEKCGFGASECVCKYIEIYKKIEEKEKKEEDSLEKRRRSDFYDTEDMYEEDE